MTDGSPQHTALHTASAASQERCLCIGFKYWQNNVYLRCLTPGATRRDPMHRPFKEDSQAEAPEMLIICWITVLKKGTVTVKATGTRRKLHEPFK